MTCHTRRITLYEPYHLSGMLVSIDDRVKQHVYYQIHILQTWHVMFSQLIAHKYLFWLHNRVTLDNRYRASNLTMASWLPSTCTIRTIYKA